MSIITLGIGASASLTPFVTSGLWIGAAAVHLPPGHVVGAVALTGGAAGSVALAGGATGSAALAGDVVGTVGGAE